MQTLFAGILKTNYEPNAHSFMCFRFPLSISPVSNQFKPGTPGIFIMYLAQRLRNVAKAQMGFLGLRFPGASKESDFERELEDFIFHLKQIKLVAGQMHLSHTSNLLQLVIDQLQMIMTLEKTLSEDFTNNSLKQQLTLKVANTLENLVIPEILVEVHGSGINPRDFLQIIGS